MVVYVNDQKKEIFTEPSVRELLIAVNLSSSKGIALAVNDKVIPKSDWEIYQLKENDRVTIIRATQGG